jgi:hypothetical protein
MIRVSIDAPGDREDRLQFLIDMADMFAERGIILGYRIPNAALRIVRHDVAIQELLTGSTGRLEPPLIVYDNGPSALVARDQGTRDLMANESVKCWLRSSSLRDPSLNNVNADIPGTERPAREVTADMAAKIRALPVIPLDHFAPYREAHIDWTQKRAIDVTFIGLVDDERSAQEHWDEGFAKAQSASTDDVSSLDHYRHEAIRQLTELKHLRVFIGMNRGMAEDLYLTAMLRSSIVISPWGRGESSLRDYEAILAGAIVIKPHSDHVSTFAPDIYQSDKYYIPCARDFSNLHEVIRSVMKDRSRAIGIAREARTALLRENSRDRIVEYFTKIFREAVGETYESFNSRAIPSPREWTSATLSLFNEAPTTSRGSLQKKPDHPEGLSADFSFIFTEDDTPDSSHDIRLARPDVAMSGLYRLRCIARPLERRSIAIMAHYAWRDAVFFAVNLETGEILASRASGSGFSLATKPKIVQGSGGWRAISAFVRIDRLLPRDLSVVIYAAEDSGKQYYSGENRRCFELAAIDIDRVSEFG